ncbi:DUF4377 domain-containing protein [Carboxylicivirga mesophila]|uniref:DUF4377 domain-containing protein n=1 Tax=Carboxylicivirga mesophila TaxID=1166478 RepID=A0ABS5K9Z1_9BACT|nr:DUF4377 domain-containing protein [Carboxylicivirga mesophila]MBS2211844.1 DUF4377 domain-containing protein [Carboxylicivirga mesophila]
MKLFLYLALFVSLTACSFQNNKKQNSGSDSDNIITYYIAPYKVSCVGVAPMNCLLVKKTPESNWEYFYSAIKGFTHEAGIEYTIKVKETTLKDVPADASSIAYELIEIVESKAYGPKATNLHDIWGVVELNGITPLSKQCEQTLELNVAEKTLLGKAGCNDFRGQFTTSDNTNEITFENLIATKMICPNQDLEDTYLKTLESVNAYFRFNSNLFLISDNQVVIKLKRMD